MMEEFDYPEFPAHKREHEMLFQILAKMKRTLVCGDYDNAIMFDFLKVWSTNHSAVFDRPFGEFLLERGMESAKKNGV